MTVSLVGRIRRRVAAERWILDAVRRTPQSRRLRRAVERRKTGRLVAATGSVDAALDAIVADALADPK